MPKTTPRKDKSSQSGAGLADQPRSRVPEETHALTVVGIGASAGGLEACKDFLAALPLDTGMAFILVQHLDPTHESMLVELLARHTSLAVRQATDGMQIASDHLYVIPPGNWLSVVDGVLHLSRPQVRQGARLPFDFLLQSLADAYGPRAICVILSGTGADGSEGLCAVKEKQGLVIVQDPKEAAFDGMPRNAIATGAVDLVLPVVEIPAALSARARAPVAPTPNQAAAEPSNQTGGLPEIIALLRSNTAHDYTLYKPGILLRRIERRMAMQAIEPHDMGKYLAELRHDQQELDLLAQDLLINVTGFFRDADIFEFLAEKIIPDIVTQHLVDQPLRIWTVGCSTGEETYSLAILFREAILVSRRDIKLQVFASDVDPDAIARAREGLFPATIQESVTPARLSQFFTQDDHGYRVAPDLRAMVVFTVQDVLSDPPFSRLDFASCRNLLIYLRPDAQAKVLSLLHFSLLSGGILLLGKAESIGESEGQFVAVSKPNSVYRHVGRSRPGEFGILTSTGGGARSVARQGHVRTPPQPAELAELCQRLVLENYAPAAVLVNRQHECLYFLGRTDRYLRIASGHASHDFLAMLQGELRPRLRAAFLQARQDNSRIVVSGGHRNDDADGAFFSIAVHPIASDGEELMLACFLDSPKPIHEQILPVTAGNMPRIAELEQELDATRIELQNTNRSLEISIEEHKAINEEALSVNEEFQSTNEELLTSKEELQSLNEELSALNGQLQETLDRQRTTANDLQNILYSTDVAAMFLDPDLNIRFFTPATQAIFNIIPSDIGRPLSDLSTWATDATLKIDAQTVFEKHTAIEREIEIRRDVWIIRRVLPYRTQRAGEEGVVVTVTDISDRKQTANALQEAKGQADLANIAKSRFLAAASHDLRQPLQTLLLLEGMLAKTVVGEKEQRLIARIDEALGAMSSMLNTLLDINQIESGMVTAEKVSFRVSDLLEGLETEFSEVAQSQGLRLRVVPSSLVISSDPRLLAQMLRNLLSNALKYTAQGTVLLGCRRRNGNVSIEVWDTGIGINNDEIPAIFGEYHQIGNAARDRRQGLGLGLFIVQRLGSMLGHRIRVHSRPGRGSVFAIEVSGSPPETDTQLAQFQLEADAPTDTTQARAGLILIVEDDLDMRELLNLLVTSDGHRTATAEDGVAALGLLEQGLLEPDLILADYNLPNGLTGLEVAMAVQKKLHRAIPVIILTGDITTSTLRDIARHNCVRMNKPVKPKDLLQAIHQLLPSEPIAVPVLQPFPREMEVAVVSEPRATIYVVDDEPQVRAAMRSALEDEGYRVEDYANCESFLAAYHPGQESCLLIDAQLPNMNGVALLEHLQLANQRVPSIMITGQGDVSTAVQAMKAGALDFLEKPVRREDLISSIGRALEQSRDQTKLVAWRKDAAEHVSGLTTRQRDIMERVLAGHPSKNIAMDLGISQRTVENHRAAIMRKTGAKSLPALARLAIAAVGSDIP